MQNIIDKKNLFGDEYKAFVLCEYQKELALTKQLINIAEDAVQKQPVIDRWSHDGICHLFAKNIVDYSKMAYDNILLGHFHATNMINRSVLENCAFLDIIISHPDEELWKYYIVHSQGNAILKLSSKSNHEKEIELCKLYDLYDIDDDFYTKQTGRKKAYIREKYGWTYKINQNFSFSGICNLLSDAERIGFQMLSRYSHGTDIDLKIGSSIFVGDIMNMFVNLYIELYRMVTLYCWDTADDCFDEIVEELECIFYNYIECEEKYDY